MATQELATILISVNIESLCKWQKCRAASVISAAVTEVLAQKDYDLLAVRLKALNQEKALGEGLQWQRTISE